MQMTLLKKFAFGAMALGACVALSPAYAEEEAEAKPAAESEDVAAVAAKPEAFFYPLIRCHLIDGCNVQVLKPGTSEWVDAEEGRFYLNGSTFRVVESVEGAPMRAEFAFGAKSMLKASVLWS